MLEEEERLLLSVHLKQRLPLRGEEDVVLLLLTLPIAISRTTIPTDHTTNRTM